MNSDEKFAFCLGIGLTALVLVCLVIIPLAINYSELEVSYETLSIPKHTCVTVENFNRYDFNLCAGDCITKGALELCYKPKPEKEQP